MVRDKAVESACVVIGLMQGGQQEVRCIPTINAHINVHINIALASRIVSGVITICHWAFAGHKSLTCANDVMPRGQMRHSCSY